MDDVPAILKAAKRLNLAIIGVSFHTGSGGVSYKSYEGCLINARKVFDQGTKLGFKMNFLDIGGGFSQSYYAVKDETKSFRSVAPKIAAKLDELFPEDLQIIAEPGTYLCESVVYMLS